jgi:hypothetical protein
MPEVVITVEGYHTKEEERSISDTSSVMELSDTYSETGVDVSQMEGQFHCHLPVTSNSPMVTRGRSRCLFESNTDLTRFLTLKMQESKSPSCRCEFCRDQGHARKERQ